MALRDQLVSLIDREGPISIARFMDISLHDEHGGYYSTRANIGADGDFVTAPHVSQMFGEILGIWAVGAWRAIGAPGHICLAELGPGRGVMMADVLRATKAAAPAFLRACDLWLIESSEPLRAQQAAAIGELATPKWTDRIEDLPGDGPIILLANEYLDCLPIRQAVRARAGWRERRVGVAPSGDLAFVLGEPVTFQSDPTRPPGDATPGAIFEWSEALIDTGRRIGEIVGRRGGAALFVDYGKDAGDLGDTLQAVSRHQKVSPLARPGEADVTARVDFTAFLAAAAEAGAVSTSLRSQRDFLIDHGILLRAEALAKSRPDRADVISRQVGRLLNEDQMGDLFRVALIIQRSGATDHRGAGSR